MVYLGENNPSEMERFTWQNENCWVLLDWLFLRCTRLFTWGRGQQAQPPFLFVQHVVPSGQLKLESHATSPACAPCLGIVGIFLTNGTEQVSSSQVMAARLHFLPCGQQWMKSSQQTACEWRKETMNALATRITSKLGLLKKHGRQDRTSGRGQQDQPPSAVLQHVVLSGQAVVSSHRTLP